MRAGARGFALSPSAAIELRQRVRATGSAVPARYGGQRQPLFEPYEADLKQLVKATPDLTLAELHAAPRGRRRRAHDSAQHAPPLRPQA